MQNIYEELKRRDLVAQVTNENEVKKLLGNQKVHFYIGFEPTADSLHVGHFVQLMVMSRLQKAGHIPIILFGGATGLIGDPSGKTDMRKMLSKEDINHNIKCFIKQASQFIDVTDGKAMILNNADWLMNLNYIDFLRDIGVHFSVNRMLAAECYKQRLEKGLTFFELNYIIMQSYDFLYLNRKFGCSLELGGDDQWSNIIGGVELIRKKDKKDAYGLTFKLLETSEGKKMGKTEKGALWLDPQKTSPYEFYQYWRNTGDQDVIKCFNMLTFVPEEKIEEYKKAEGKEINNIKKILAFEITKLVHGEAEAEKARKMSDSIFESTEENAHMPEFFIEENILNGESMDILSLLFACQLADSKSDARRLIQQGGIALNGEKISDVYLKVYKETLLKGAIIKKGKKIFKKIFISKN